jgi:hypothetical protein
MVGSDATKVKFSKLVAATTGAAAQPALTCNGGPTGDGLVVCKKRLGTCSAVHVLASTSFRRGAETAIREPTRVSSPRSDCAIHEESQAFPPSIPR